MQDSPIVLTTLAGLSTGLGGLLAVLWPPRPVDSPARVVSTIGESCIDTPPFMGYQGMRRGGRGMTAAQGVLF